MRVYLDSSAIVKLVQREAESDALRRFLRDQSGSGRVTSALARVEVVRAVDRGGPAAVAHARRQLKRIDQVLVDNSVLDAAASLAPGTGLRSLDAIHLATALTLGAELEVIVTYDTRQQSAAELLGLRTTTPRKRSG